MIERRVVEVRDRFIYVCRSDEYERAAAEGRAPLAVGFPVVDVLTEGLQPSG